MSTFKMMAIVIATSAVTAVGSIWGYTKFIQKNNATTFSTDKLPANYAGFTDGNSAGPGDFTASASASLPAVVHIKTKFAAKQVSNQRQANPFGDDDFFGDFFRNFGGPSVIPEQRASGSGVIISNDGYIVTNNHVIADVENNRGGDKGGTVADEIKVTLNNKKTYTAKLVGRDPSSDLAVLKIDATNLPFLVTGNSDDVKIGQWVLAIGYPLNLETTVTAGIVSAKARSLNINGRQSASPVESFIQTDAAVNPGNSGGALVNTNGQLIGINAAIASKTGYYSGYSYAIPVNIVKKITSDIIKTGNVQRAYIGIQYPNDLLTDEQRTQAGIKEGKGVYVSGIPKDGAAAAAGIKKGDYINKINNQVITSGPEIQEQVANFKPGDVVQVEYERDGKMYTTKVTLKGSVGTLENDYAALYQKLGVTLAEADDKAKKEFDLAGGVVIKTVTDGLFKQQNPRIKPNFIIAKVNNTIVRNIAEFAKAIEAAGNSATITGFYSGSEYLFQYSLNDLTGEGANDY